MSFNPAGTMTFRTAPDDVFEAPQTAGVTNVTRDSEITLASLDVEGPATADFLAGSTVTGITAFAGGGQGGATELTASNNFISVCATNADSVQLPANAPVGAPVYIRNGGVGSAQVFAATPGTINGAATATGVSLAAGASATYRQSVAGTWFT